MGLDELRLQPALNADARRILYRLSCPATILYSDLSGVGCPGLVDEDVVVDDDEPGGEDVVEADDDEEEEVGDEEELDLILETEGAHYCPDNQPGEDEQEEVDNLEDDVAAEEARLGLGEAEDHQEDVEERRGPLEDGQEGLIETEGGGEGSQASQADGRLQAGQDVAASQDVSLEASGVVLPHLLHQAAGEVKEGNIAEDQNDGEGNSTEGELARLAVGGGDVAEEEVQPLQDEEEAGEGPAPAKELSSAAEGKSQSVERHRLVLLSLIHREVQAITVQVQA